MNPVRRLLDFGQSPWLDTIRRRLLTSGELARHIREDGVRGLTSNPTLFAKAILEHDDYRAAIARYRGRCRDAAALYETLALEDVRLAADGLRPVWEETGGRDGYVSLEVSPELAYDAEGTLAEARRLWIAIDRPNAMIKVPATTPGLEAIQRLTAEGINVNATLIFSPARYEAVARAWAAGVRERLEAGASLDGKASVASFFVSRIDTLADRLLQERAAAGDAQAAAWQGRVAVAAAKAAYLRYQTLAGSPQWQRLREAGVPLQRLLWASTSTKNPDYPDTKYVEALVGPETVVTLPPETLAAYRAHGDPAPRLTEDLEQAVKLLEALRRHGIAIEALAETLEREGVAKFEASWRRLLEALAGA